MASSLLAKLDVFLDAVPALDSDFEATLLESMATCDDPVGDSCARDLYRCSCWLEIQNCAMFVKRMDLKARHGPRHACFACLFGIFMVERTLDLVTCLVSGDAARFSMDPTQRTSSSRVPAHQVSEIGLRPDTKASFSFPPEPSVGKVEHKLRLTAEEGSERFEELVTQLNWRMRECSSAEECADLEELSQYRDALYRLGVSDDGQVPGLSDAELAESLSVLKAMAAQIPATVTVISQTGGIGPGNRTAITALVRACQSSFFLRGGDEVRICTVGNVDSWT